MKGVSCFLILHTESGDIGSWYGSIKCAKEYGKISKRNGACEDYKIVKEYK